MSAIIERERVAATVPSLDCANTSLYGSSLGIDAALAEPVRAMHCTTHTVHGRGHFRVTRGSRALGRLIAALLRLPGQGDDVPVALTIERCGDNEIWRRRFASRAFTTRQHLVADEIVERVGPVELVLDLHINDTALVIRSNRARVVVGRLRLTLPRCVTPMIHATVRGARDDTALHVSVTISSTVVGQLLAYEGVLVQAGEP